MIALLLALISVNVSSTNLGFDDLLTVDITTDEHLDDLRSGLDLREGEEGTFTIVSESCVDDTYTFVLEPWRSGESLVGFLPEGGEGGALYEVTIAPPTQTPDPVEIAGLIPYEDRPLIELNLQNRRLAHESDAEVAHHLQQRLHRRHLPWKWIGAGCGLLLLTLGVQTLRRRPKRPKTIHRDPRLTALAALDQLASKQLAQQGHFKLFYSELTFIVRRYIEESYGLRAPEQTTEEFLDQASNHPAFDTDARQMLRTFLNAADMVKFARLDPTAQECSHALATCRAFIAK